MSNEEQLKILNTKVQQLVAQFNSLQKENVALKKQLEKREKQLKEKEENYEVLQQKMDGLKLGSNVWNEEDKKLLQKRIDTYLKEIEKCLRILNQ